MTDSNEYGALVISAIAKRIMSKACPVCARGLWETSGIRAIAVYYDKEKHDIIPYAVCRDCHDIVRLDEDLADRLERRFRKSTRRYSAPEMVALIPGIGDALHALFQAMKHGGH